jgi:Protein of unknown function DUF262
MSLDKQIESARKEIATDGYDMSVGEILNLYRDDELIIHPEYQRLFRWDPSRKTRFIESLLLGIPLPPIFVFQTKKGLWELIDGLQRLSTIFEFVGVLKSPPGVAPIAAPAQLQGTNFLPDLSEKAWEADGNGVQGIGKDAQLYIKRARIRVEILKKESDPLAKYELFQRLNTGGAQLTEQEVRNCIALMINPQFYRWLADLSQFSAFQKTTAQTEVALKKQAGVELALRFLAFRNVPYQPGLDVHEYLDKSLVDMASNTNFPMPREKLVFERTFRIMQSALDGNAFRRWDGHQFTGKFLMSLFEVITTGVSSNIDAIEGLRAQRPAEFISARAKALWNDPIFQNNSGAGVRGTTRLAKLLPMGPGFFKP